MCPTSDEQFLRLQTWWIVWYTTQLFLFRVESLNNDRDHITAREVCGNNLSFYNLLSVMFTIKGSHEAQEQQSAILTVPLLPPQAMFPRTFYNTSWMKIPIFEYFWRNLAQVSLKIQKA